MADVKELFECKKRVKRNKLESNNWDTVDWWHRLFGIMENEFRIVSHLVSDSYLTAKRG